MNFRSSFVAACALARRAAAALAAAAFAMLAAAPAPASTKVAVLATDYGASGRVSTCTTHAPWTPATNLATTCSDAVLRYFDGLFYVVNRFGCDNIQVLDPASGFATLRQFSVGAGSNPYDIAFWSDTKAYVSRYDTDSLWVVNPETGAHLKSISLAPLADADGIPEMDHMILLGGKLFVSVQRLDRNNFYTTTGPGRIAVIDVATDTLVDVDPGTAGKQGIVLAAGNPVTPLEWNLADRKFYVGEAGDYGVIDGGIEAVDPATLSASGLLVREDSLGGDVSVIRLSSATQGYAIISDASFNTKLVRFDVTTHRKFATPYPATGFVLADCLLDDLGRVWLSDRTVSAPGLRVFDVATGAQLTGADRKSTRLNSSHIQKSRMPSSA